MTEQGQEGSAPDSDAAPSPATVEPDAATSLESVESAAPTARVVLVGLPGSGKSTIGRKLARELGVQLYDTDAGIEADTGRTIPDIFATDGEAEFRRIEEEVVRRAVLTHDGVVSLGGGSVLSARTRDLLRDALVVYLEISVSEGVRRTGASSTRPLLNGVDPAAKYRDLMRERRPLYREIASVRVRTDGRSPGRVVRMIMAKLGLESVRTDLDAARPNIGNAGATSGSVTGRPGTGSNRSKNRRRARARAAAARRGGAEQTNTVATEPRGGVDDRNRTAATPSVADGATAEENTGATRTAGTAQGEARTTGSRRSRRGRSRRGGARIRSAGNIANRDAGSSVSENTERSASARTGATEQPGNRNADTDQVGDRAAGTGTRASSRGGSRAGGRGAVAGQAGGRTTGRGRRSASREAGAPRVSHRGGEADARGGAGHRGGEPAGPAGPTASDSSAEGRTPQQVSRTGPSGDADRAAGTNERRRRAQPRRRSGRRNNSDQKESEQRT